MNAAASSSLPRSPSPHRDGVHKGALLAFVWAGPVAWAAQLLCNFALASHTCFPQPATPLTQILPGWQRVWAALLIVNALAAAVAIAAAVMSLRHWYRAREEASGSSHDAFEAGEGRTRFLALCGVMNGFGFLAAIGFNTIALFVVPQCIG